MVNLAPGPPRGGAGEQVPVHPWRPSGLLRVARAQLSAPAEDMATAGEGPRGGQQRKLRGPRGVAGGGHPVLPGSWCQGGGGWGRCVKGAKRLATYNLPPATCHLPPATSNLEPHKPPASCKLPPAACHLPPATSHLQPPTSHLQAATCHLPPTTCHLPPAASHLQPPTGHLPYVLE